MLDFSNTKNAFADKSDKELQMAYLLFKLMNNTFLSYAFTNLALLSLKMKMPVRHLIKKTVFFHFCGGETLEEARETILRLNKFNVKTIFDYSVEGSTHSDNHLDKLEENYNKTAKNILNMIEYSRKLPAVSFISVKMTGIARKNLLKKVSETNDLDKDELAEFEKVKNRLNHLCNAAYEADIYINIDAEETWFQPAMDKLCMDMMRKYNKKKPIVSNTYQMYVCNKFNTIKQHYDISKKEGFYYGVKLVRGAYLEKERRVAVENGYASPVYSFKQETDDTFDEAIAFCLQDVEHISLCVASHNEKSNLLTTQLMEKKQIPKNHPNVWFAQLLGMSDTLSFNLAHENYNAAKYVPYGPVLSTMPYLIRRSQENSAIAGQMGRELQNISLEKKRRRNIKGGSKN
ncbi:MAG: proline dehydrogenase family protein [Bacteroidota bacterium]